MNTGELNMLHLNLCASNRTKVHLHRQLMRTAVPSRCVNVGWQNVGVQTFDAAGCYLANSAEVQRPSACDWGTFIAALMQDLCM